jgi:hypothetical protein
MAPNPFIEFAQDPVSVLAWFGYGLLLVAIFGLAVPWSVRQYAKLITQYHRNKHGGDWWAFGDRSAGYIPPAGWLGWAFFATFVLAIATWSAGALIWLVS